IEEHSRLVAEEDKRRRNTAASARFRVKKKQREQQLEKTAKEMTDKVNSLESRIAQLEMENKWLKGLITEKNDGKTGGDIAELYKKFVGADKDDRNTGERTDG
ncbi:putative regulatory protein cys-3, partial [Saccharata proteae CBS 121410]